MASLFDAFQFLIHGRRLLIACGQQRRTRALHWQPAPIGRRVGSVDGVQIDVDPGQRTLARDEIARTHAIHRVVARSDSWAAALRHCGKLKSNARVRSTHQDCGDGETAGIPGKSHEHGAAPRISGSTSIREP
jgi:hypothetical protein